MIESTKLKNWVFRSWIPLSLLFSNMIPYSSSAADLPDGFVETKIMGGLKSPTTLEFAPDGRLFVAEQGGTLRVIQNGKLLPTPFLTLNVDNRGEHGLLGFTFDPDFLSNAYFYVYYTTKEPYVHNRLSRFTANGDAVVPGTEKILLDLPSSGTSIFHAGGGVVKFGLDGMLYIGVGDHALYLYNADSLNVPFGKLLRLHKDGSIPADNPFYNQTQGINKAIWAMGLRNPYSFDIQKSTGLIYINDVGGTKFEEINDGKPGKHYGWAYEEGYSSNPQYTSPIFAYPHGPVGSDDVGCAITGGVFYQPQQKMFPPSYHDQYFFMDFCNGWIKLMDPHTHKVSSFASDIASNPTGLKLGPDGALYYISRWLNGVYSIRYNP